MASKTIPERWALIDAPTWLWGGVPYQLFINAGFQIKKHLPGSAIVCTDEAYTRSQPDLVRLLKIAGPGGSGDWLALNSMGDDEVEASALQVGAEYLKREATDGSLVGLATYYQLATTSVLSGDLSQQAQNAHESLLECTLDTGGQVFPHAGVYAIKRSDQLIHRIKLVSVLLRLQHDSVLQGGDISSLKAEHATETNVFAASAGLQEGFYFLDQYVGPLLGALTPAVWGFMAARANGPVMYSFGRQVAGTSSVAGNLLDTLPTRGADRVTEFVELSSDAVPSALSWWVSGLNDLFSIVSDPAIFRNTNGDYQAAQQLQAVLTVEQLFSRVLSIQAADADTNARRVLLFTVLDTVEALTGHPIELTTRLSFAIKTLDNLSAAIPAPAAEILLPRAQAAVDALRQMQSGFFIREPDGTILLRPSTRQSESPERAVAEYLKTLRNATHGHGAKKAAQVEVTDSLLARHNGTIPHTISLLGWLYLLDLLHRPDSLRAVLVSRARRGSK
ncbi:hypothetical protein [Pimelobacter simplex]|uniref:hypothetical protein n=1 Tax=Nocardioides simplex TaxID=2045 RepID=UPI003AAF211F